MKNVLICYAARRELPEPAELKEFTNIVYGILNKARLHYAYARALQTTTYNVNFITEQKG